MTDKPKDHNEPGGGPSAPSPFDQPTEKFAAVPDPRKQVLAHTDEDLDYGSPHADSLPTEQIPTFRRDPGAAPPPDEFPTTVIERRDPLPPPQGPAVTEPIALDPAVAEPGVSEPVAPQPLVSQPVVSQPVVSEPIAPESVGDRPAAAGPAVVPAAAPPARGTLDVGLLLLRLAVGATLLVHGLQKLTGWWDGPGLDGYRDQLAAGGFDQAGILAIVGAVGEVAGGLFLILGLLTPFAAAAVVAVLINAWCLRQSAAPGLEYFAPDGIEYETLLLAASAAIALTGPGRLALDGRRRFATRPHAGSAVILLVGVAAGVCVWIFLNGANPVI